MEYLFNQNIKFKLHGINIYQFIPNLEFKNTNYTK